jgi:hypothetical protein
MMSEPKNDPAQMFQQIMQQLTQGQGLNDDGLGAQSQVAFGYLSQPMADVPTTKITLCHDGFDVI